MNAREEKKRIVEEEIQGLLTTLPDYMRKFDLILAEREEVGFRTRLQYINHVADFLDYCRKNKSYKLSNLNEVKIIQAVDVLDWKRTLEYTTRNGKVYPASPSTVATKISAVKKFFSCFENQLGSNPASSIKRPKVHDKKPEVLTDDEMHLLISNIQSGVGSSRAKARQKKSFTRDMTILYLLSCTGIRIEALVGLNLQDVDLSECTIQVTSKGNVTSVKNLNSEVMYWLKKYCKERMMKKVGTNALFISNQNSRINERTVQAMIKKYSTGINKNVTPHMFRKTFGTKVHKATGDIKLVADLLDHSNIQTTSKHYVLSDYEQQRDAVNSIRFVKSS